MSVLRTAPGTEKMPKKATVDVAVVCLLQPLTASEVGTFNPVLEVKVPEAK